MTEADNVHRATRGAGSYEVWHLTFTDPATGRGYWVRYTYHAPVRGSYSAAAWFARFEPAEPTQTFGLRRSFSTWALATQTFDVRIGDATWMTPGRAVGFVEAGGRSVAWDLEFPTGEPTYPLLPPPFYRGRLSSTKPLAPNPDTRFTGVVRVDGEEAEIRDAPGQQGHVWGSRHAERWAWAHCSRFDDEEAVVHAVTAQARRGPFLTPFVTSIGVKWQGRWLHLLKMSRTRDFGLGAWHVDAGNRRYRLTGRIEAPARALLRARYEDPDGSPRFCHNSEIASCRLALFERKAGGFEEVALLESRGTTHAEWAGRTPAAAVEREFVEAAE